jgi:hypothetical protein
MALMAAALGQGLVRGVHRTARFTRRKPGRLKWRRASNYTPHQGAQERLRRVLGGWARSGTTKNQALGPHGPRRHEAAAVMLQKCREKGMAA